MNYQIVAFLSFIYEFPAPWQNERMFDVCCGSDGTTNIIPLYKTIEIL